MFGSKISRRQFLVTSSGAAAGVAFFANPLPTSGASAIPCTPVIPVPYNAALDYAVSKAICATERLNVVDRLVGSIPRSNIPFRSISAFNAAAQAIKQHPDNIRNMAAGVFKHQSLPEITPTDFFYLGPSCEAFLEGVGHLERVNRTLMETEFFQRNPKLLKEWHTAIKEFQPEAILNHPLVKAVDVICRQSSKTSCNSQDLDEIRGALRTLDKEGLECAEYEGYNCRQKIDHYAELKRLSTELEYELLSSRRMQPSNYARMKVRELSRKIGDYRFLRVYENSDVFTGSVGQVILNFIKNITTSASLKDPSREG